MKRTKIKALLNAQGPASDVLVMGWVRTRRDSKEFSFIEVNDGSCFKQPSGHSGCKAWQLRSNHHHFNRIGDSNYRQPGRIKGFRSEIRSPGHGN